MIFFTKLTNKKMVWNRNEMNTAVCCFTETLIPLVLTLLQQAKKDAYRMQPGVGIMFFFIGLLFSTTKSWKCLVLDFKSQVYYLLV